MKKRFFALFFVFLLSTTVLADTHYTLTGADYPIMVNGEALSSSDAPAMNYQGRTMLPLRAVSEALDVPIEWDDAKKQVNIDTIDLEALKESCVMVSGGIDGQYVNQASGVLIDYDEVLTCYHVIDGKDYLEINYDDSNAANVCKLADTAEAEDAAILTPPGKDVKPVKIGDSDEVRIGDRVYIVSCPDGEKNVVTEGEVLSIKYVNTNENGKIEGFLISNASQPGSSGGAVFTSYGLLIGFVTAGDAQGSVVVPINDARKALAS